MPLEQKKIAQQQEGTYAGEEVNIPSPLTRVSPLIVFITLFIAYFLYHRAVMPISSDVTTMLPLLQDWLAGNILLSGWVVGTNSFFFTDTIWCAPWMLLKVDCPTITSIAAALFRAGYVALMLWLLMSEDERRTGRQANLLIAGGFVLLAGVVPLTGIYPYLNLNGHAGAFFCMAILLCLLAEWRRAEGGGAHVWLALFVAFGALFYASDGVTLMLLFGPLCVWASYYAIVDWHEKGKRRRALIMCAVSIAVVLCGKAFHVVIYRLGGFIRIGYPTEILGLAGLRGRANAYLGMLYQLFGFDPGMWSTLPVFAIVVHVLLVLIALATLAQIVLAFQRKADGIALFFALAICANIVGCLFVSTVPAPRYIMGVPLYGFALMARTVALLRWKEGLSTTKERSITACPRLISFARVATAVLVVFYCVSVSVASVSEAKAQDTDMREVAAYIQEHNLGTGYGEFWAASVVSSYSDFQNLTMQVTSSEESLAPYYMLNKASWYHANDIHYVLCLKGDPGAVSCREGDVRACCGKPDTVVEIGGYRLMIYQKDLSVYLRGTGETDG